MVSRKLALVHAAVVLLLLNGCSREAVEAGREKGSKASAPVQRVSVVGASTIAPLMGELAKHFEKSHPDVRVDVQAGGSARGLMEVRQGTADLGMVSRELKADEADLSKALIARDGLGIIVHQSNPLQQISKAQVIEIFSGKLANWRQLGGPDLPITVVSKAEGRSTLEIFSAYFGLPYREIRAQVVIGDNQQGIQTVAGARGAIGYVSIGAAEFEATQGTAIKLLALDGHTPSTAQVAAGRYPITRELNLVFKPPLKPVVSALLDSVRSPEVAGLIAAQFFVPPAPP